MYICILYLLLLPSKGILFGPSHFSSWWKNTFCQKERSTKFQQMKNCVMVIRTCINSKGIKTNFANWNITAMNHRFCIMFQVASPNRPLIFLLDGLDQLSSSHRAHNLAWLPIILPANVHVVVTTLPNRYELKDTLKSKIPQNDNFICVLPLPSKLSINIVKEWLKRADRTLTPPQFVIVEKALARSPLPLYTSLVFEEVCRWSSYATPDETILEPTIQGVINRLFDRVEKYHGRLLVKHYLSYLTASKNGLNNTELEDILSLDDEVLNDVFQHWLPPVRRIPPLLLPRLQDELSSYVMEREANGTVVIYWYHAQFIEVVRERYLADEPHRHYIHSLVAHYFLGTWSGGKKKPFKYS